MNTSEVLNKAADLIEQRGWIGREDAVADYWGGGAATGAPVCLEGGILAALGVGLPSVDAPISDRDEVIDQLHACPSYRAVHAYLNLGETRALWYWNDQQGRTASEVIEVLRATAVIEAAREDQDAAFATYAGQVSA